MIGHTIWKFEFAIAGVQRVPMPQGAEFLSVGALPPAAACFDLGEEATQ